MKRNIEKLKSQQFDIIVIGAGIHGACIARDAAIRGLNVALIDKGDICGQTSHNSLKIIHGGIRYLQHLNIKRTLESIQEQKIWLAIAPHLVRPMQCIMPTYGHGMRGPEAMWCGIKAFEFLGLGRNRNIPEYRRIPKGKIISRESCLRLAPGINQNKLTGGAIWYDAQVFAADEAVLETAASAANHGAEVANYVSAQRILYDGQKVTGIQAKDELTQREFEIIGSLVINAAGPWAKKLLSTVEINNPDILDLPLTESMNIVTRPIFGDYAVAIESKRKSDSVIGSTKRLYFFTPWNNCTVVGTTHFPYDGNPDSLHTSKTEISQFIAEINEVYPPANLTLDDVRYCYKGLTPAEEPQAAEQNSKSETNRSHQSKIIDHAADGADGIISVIGIKYTTARLVAEKCVNMICTKLGKAQLTCQTRTKSLENSNTEAVDPETLDDQEFRGFCQYQIDNSMATHLTDLVLRRMNLAIRGKLTATRLNICVDVLSRSFNWDAEQRANEIEKMSKIWLSQDIQQNLNSLNNMADTSKL